MENLYNILKISNDAKEKEIKRAYVKMIRKYTPEKEPEKFKKIRDAYDKLINPITRAEYDAYHKYGKLIKKYEKLGDAASENREYDKAALEYKKILDIEPKLLFAKEKLGLALANTGKYELALNQFRELININPENIKYYDGIAYVYKEQFNYTGAERALLKAHKLEPFDDNIILNLSRLYIDAKQEDKAILFLKDCIVKNKTKDFKEFIYYFELMRIYVLLNNDMMVYDIMDEIQEKMPKNYETKSFVALKFGKLAYELFNSKVYDIAQIICKKALEIDKYNESIKQLYDYCNNLKKIFDMFDKLAKDKRVIDPLKGPIFYYLYGEEYENEKLFESFNKNIEAIQSYMDKENKNVIYSLKILKNEYRVLYSFRLDLYDYVEEKTINKQSIVDNLDFYRSQRKRYLDNIISEVACDCTIELSSNKSKVNYPSLYKANVQTLNESLNLYKASSPIDINKRSKTKVKNKDKKSVVLGYLIIISTLIYVLCYIYFNPVF